MKLLKENDVDIPPTYLQEFGQRIREVRQKLDILQKDFAEALGVSGSFLSELENGKNRPGLLFSKKMSTVFNISIDYILNGDGDPFRPIPGEPTVIPSVNDDSPDSEGFIELNYYMKNSPFVKHAIFTYFTDFIFKNNDIIQDDIRKHQIYLQKKKLQSRKSKR
jgi:transcriptional regulator with XRE-family HTH domain